MTLSRTQINAGNSIVLTEHARRLVPVGFIADQVFPRVQKPGLENGALRLWDDTGMNSPTDALRAIGKEASEAYGMVPTYITWASSAYARKILLTQRELNQWAANGNDPAMLEFVIAAKLAQNITILRELDLATKLTATGNFDSSHSTSIGAGAVWTNKTASDPLGDLDTAVNQCISVGTFPDVMIMDTLVHRALQVHPDLLSQMNYVEGGRVTDAGIEAITGLKPIVAKCRYRTAAGAMTPIWGDSCIVAKLADVSVDSMAAEGDMGLGITIVSSDMDIIDYPDQERDHINAKWIECEFNFVHTFVGVDNSSDADSLYFTIDNAI